MANKFQKDLNYFKKSIAEVTCKHFLKTYDLQYEFLEYISETEDNLDTVREKYLDCLEQCRIIEEEYNKEIYALKGFKKYTVYLGIYTDFLISEKKVKKVMESAVEIVTNTDKIEDIVNVVNEYLYEYSTVLSSQADLYKHLAEKMKKDSNNIKLKVDKIKDTGKSIWR